MKNIINFLKGAAVCVGVIILASCSQAFQSAGHGKIPVPAGKGIIQLSVAAPSARTIFPERIDEFEYSVTFTTNDTVVEDEVTIELVGGKVSAVLEPATWNIVITASLDGEDVGEAVIENVVLAVGDIKKFNDIYIQPIRDPSAADGTLAYSIKISADTVSAALYYVSDDDELAVEVAIPLNVPGLNTGSIPLAPGAYLVRALVDGAGKVEIVYIYPGLESTVAWSFVGEEGPIFIIEDFETGSGNFTDFGNGYWAYASPNPGHPWHAGFADGAGESYNLDKGAWFGENSTFGRTGIMYDLSNYEKITFWVKSIDDDAVYTFKLNDSDAHKVDFSVDAGDWVQVSFTMAELGFTGDVVITDWAFTVKDANGATGNSFIDYVCAEKTSVLPTPTIIDDMSLGQAGIINVGGNWWAGHAGTGPGGDVDPIPAAQNGGSGALSIARTNAEIDFENDITAFKVTYPTVSLKLFSRGAGPAPATDHFTFELRTGNNGSVIWTSQEFTIERNRDATAGTAGDVEGTNWTTIKIPLSDFWNAEGNPITGLSNITITGWRINAIVGAINLWITDIKLIDEVITTWPVRKINAKAPVITQDTTLTNPPAVQGVSFILHVAATSPDGGTLTYQWHRVASNNTDLVIDLTNSTFNSYTISGEKTDTMSYRSSSGTNYSYYCVITNTITDNGDGGIKTASVSSTKEAIAPATAVNAGAPTISDHPASAVYPNIDDEAVDLFVTAALPATNAGILTYQWWSSTVSGSDAGAAIPDATDPTYTPSTAASGTTWYWVVVTNDASGVPAVNATKTASVSSSKAVITVAVAPPTFSTNAEIRDIDTAGAHAGANALYGLYINGSPAYANGTPGTSSTVFTGTTNGAPTANGDIRLNPLAQVAGATMVVIVDDAKVSSVQYAVTNNTSTSTATTDSTAFSSAGWVDLDPDASGATLLGAKRWTKTLSSTILSTGVMQRLYIKIVAEDGTTTRVYRYNAYGTINDRGVIVGDTSLKIAGVTATKGTGAGWWNTTVSPNIVPGAVSLTESQAAADVIVNSTFTNSATAGFTSVYRIPASAGYPLTEAYTMPAAAATSGSTATAVATNLTIAGGVSNNDYILVRYVSDVANSSNYLFNTSYLIKVTVTPDP